MGKVKLCNNCKNNRKNDDIWESGYVSWISDDNYECPICHQKLIDTILTSDEDDVLTDVSRSASFFDSMIKLKQDNPIEFQLKLTQFKNQTQQIKIQEGNNVVKCPTCQSTNISKIGTLNRMASVGLFGLASSKIGKTHKCNSCGGTW